MYVTGGYIIEELTNRTYMNYITEKIFQPLDLRDTTFNATTASKSGKLADGFVQIVPCGQEKCVEFKPVPYWDPLAGHSVVDPAGGIISNVKDLVC
jgi:CubicO group peptidase (beta-lactamase class C family)